MKLTSHTLNPAKPMKINAEFPLFFSNYTHHPTFVRSCCVMERRPSLRSLHGVNKLHWMNLH